MGLFNNTKADKAREAAKADQARKAGKGAKRR